MTALASFAPPRRIPVAVLGATGTVGQTFVRLLADHPWFELVAVAASSRSVGLRFHEVTPGRDADFPMVGDFLVHPCDPAAINAPVVFSALDGSIARDIEQSFARAGRVVLTNAGAHRMDADVPLVIPEVNPEHLGLLDQQRIVRGWSGAIVANGNCAAIVIAMALAPLHRAFGVRRVMTTTLQAVSGAGYPGVPSIDILGNIIPFIGGDEEAKIEREIPRMLGTLVDGGVRPASVVVSAQVNRVAVEHGHSACLTVGLENPVPLGEVMDAITSWHGAEVVRELPSAPAQPLALTLAENRPQPRRDCDAGGGMTVTVGRVRSDPILDLRMVACGHNTVRGAAGTAILNAELMVARGMVKRSSS